MEKHVKYSRFALGAVVEMWHFEHIVFLIMLIPTAIFTKALNWLSYSTGSVITTASVGALLSWRLPFFLILTVLFALLCIWIEVICKILLCNGLLKNDSKTSLAIIKNSFGILQRFFRPLGVVVILFILFAAPLCGVGFFISPTKNLYIPKFIMSFISAHTFIYVVYLLVLFLILYVTFRYMFVFHGVGIGDKTIDEALKESYEITGKYWKKIILSLIKASCFSALVLFLALLFFNSIPSGIIDELGKDIPSSYRLDLQAVMETKDETMINVLGYRIVSACTILLGNYFVAIFAALSANNILLTITRLYHEYTDGGELIHYKGKLTLKKFTVHLVFVIGVPVAIIIAGVFVGMFFEDLFIHENSVPIVAHRTGGTLASENSLEGIEQAFLHGCYGSETDIQRTKDNGYIINHDSDFKRLTGVAKTPGELTMEEISELCITDTTGNGQKLTVPTLDELLDAGRGKVRLFLELKGVSADKQMVDDVVAMVKDKDMVNNVTLISLKQDVVFYAEDTYPEFETGLLIFGSVGDVSKLNCDLIIMEEEMTTNERVDRIHQAGKKALVWTVNDSMGMRQFLCMDLDGIITDEIQLAEKVQQELDARSDLRIMEDALEDVFMK